MVLYTITYKTCLPINTMIHINTSFMKLILLPVWQFSSMKPTAHSHIYPLGVDNMSVQVAPFWQSFSVSQGAGEMNRNTIRLHEV